VVIYGVNDGELLVFDSSPTWRGRFDGEGVRHVLSLAESDDAVVLLEAPPIDDSLQPFFNLVRVRPNGEIVWRAEHPIPEDWTDGYVAVEQNDGVLSANSWSCYYVVLDPDTGRILSSVFTK
jgi:hypothetical protein